MRLGPATAECAEIAVLGFVVAGTVNADVNTRALARYLGGNVALSNLLGASIGSVTPLCCCSDPRPLGGALLAQSRQQVDGGGYRSRNEVLVHSA